MGIARLQLEASYDLLRLLVAPCVEAGLEASPALAKIVAELTEYVRLPKTHGQVKVRALIAKDYCYEQLYVGDWSSVDVRWRALYRTFCHLLAISQLLCNELKDEKSHQTTAYGLPGPLPTQATQQPTQSSVALLRTAMG
jgi:hypothetical protein